MIIICVHPRKSAAKKHFFLNHDNAAFKDRPMA